MVLIYNRKYDIFLQTKRKRERDKGRGWFRGTNIAQNLGWFGGSVPFKGWDHLTDPQICLNLEIVDEYLPWTVSSLKINDWKMKSPFGMAYFQGLCYLSPGNENNHGVTSCDLDLDGFQGVVDYGWGFSISKHLGVTGSCNWQQVSSPQWRNIKKLVPKLYILSILL